MLKSKVTPMMAQYLTIKEENPECLLFFRLGDFYEMFFEDAKTCSRELEITLTGKDCGLEERAPMCGVPFHSAETYISRLVEKGYKVAICEQIEDPKEAKGLVKRGVVRIVTPGTILEGGGVTEGKNNYIASVVVDDRNYGFSICDVTTGEWLTTSIDIAAGKGKLLDELAKFEPVECLLSEQVYEDEEIFTFIKDRIGSLIDKLGSHEVDVSLSKNILLKHFEISSLGGVGLTDGEASTLATSSLLGYLKATQKTDLAHLKNLSLYNVDSYMLLDISTRRNLELTETLREKKRKGSLLWVLDETKTAMGSRYMRKCIEQPLINANDINKRLESTEQLKNSPLLRADLFECLSEIYDIERLVSKFSFGTCNAKDMIALKNSLQVIPSIKSLLKESNSKSLTNLNNELIDLSDIYSLIDNAISEDCPVSVREGNIIKLGYDEQVDHLRQVKSQGASWLMDIETREKENTGIKNLKVKYNKVFGYFLEVTQSYSHLVPDYFIRKQTLSNCERYITEELKKVEEDVLGADDKLNVLEYDIFTKIRLTIVNEMPRLLSVSKQIAKLDMFCSLADVADKYGYVKPNITDEYNTTIKKGRHPVVEKIIGEGQFISNDVIMTKDSSEMMLLTGPNMAGKSTYMRQVALIVLMAQIGSFVPADSADISVVDRIFTRVGASDDLASGQSTFMVEMMEVANILHHATPNSLLILDEIGRGTSTLDGLSIAWSIIEHITDKIRAKTLFATHYHELTVLEDTIPHLKNYCVAVKEIGEDILFLHQIIEGSVDHSYGIAVAKLAGVPKCVLGRAKELLVELEQGEVNVNFTNSIKNEKLDSSFNEIKIDDKSMNPSKMIQNTQVVSEQLDLFNNQNDDVIGELKNADLINMTPFKALELLYTLQQKIKI